MLGGLGCPLRGPCQAPQACYSILEQEMKCLGRRVEGFRGFRVSGLGFRVWGLGLGLRVWGVGL